MSTVKDRILIITDLLLGAAYADQKLAGSEEKAVRELLGKLLGEGKLPPEVEKRIKTFPAGTFELDVAAADFSKDPPMQKRKLLELVAAVRDADDEIDLSEDDYLKNLAVALDMKTSEYSDLTLDYEVEELAETFEELRSGS